MFKTIFTTVLSRQEWYDAELRHTGVLVHAVDSRRHMIVCFLIRRVFGVVAILAFLGQIIALIVLSLRNKASEPTPSYLTTMVKVSQIACTSLAIVIQIYHWRALLGVAAVLEIVPSTDEDIGKPKLLNYIEEGHLDGNDILRKETDAICPADRELSYSEIVTGDRSHCGYSSHTQRTETYLVGDVYDNDEVDEAKGSADERNTSISGTRVAGRRSLTRQTVYNRCKSNADEDCPRPDDIVHLNVSAKDAVPLNDLTSLLNGSHHAQLAAPHNPIVSDKTTWVFVMATCICFLITSIPASIRTYLGAFILYSLVTRILEIAAASLLLSPFQIRNTAFRKRLAAKIRESSGLHSNASTTVACRQDLEFNVGVDSRNMRSAKKSRYAEVNGNDDNSSSLTVSILHRPDESITGRNQPKDEPDGNMAWDEGDSDHQTNLNGSNILNYLEDQSNGEEELWLSKSGIDTQKEGADISVISCTLDKSSEVVVLKEGKSGGAWVDRWAKNIRGSDAGKLSSPTQSNAPDNKISCTSSVTSGTNAFMIAQRNQREAKFRSLPSPKIQLCGTVSPQSHSPHQQLSPQQPPFDTSRFGVRLSPHQQSRNSSSIKMRSSSGSGYISGCEISPVGKSRSLKPESPRSIANTDPVSPITTSVMGTKKVLTVKQNSSEVRGMMTLTTVRPQEQWGPTTTEKIKMTVITTPESPIIITKLATQHRAEDENKFYESWTKQSTSKLTYRANARSSAFEARSPRSPKSPKSPKSPDMTSYDGDVEKDSNQGSGKFLRRKASASLGTRGSARTVSSVTAPRSGSIRPQQHSVSDASTPHKTNDTTPSATLKSDAKHMISAPSPSLLTPITDFNYAAKEI
jgi:hypothetical protein